jgi:glycosyltransferase involved in cell wall biosynthesis
MHWKADLVIFLGDPWAQQPAEFSSLKNYGCKIAVWYPCDSTPLPFPDTPVLNLADYIIPLSWHGWGLLEKAGLDPQKVIPHGLDLDLWRPMPPEPNTLSPCVGMVQANFGTRKMIASQLEAFTEACLLAPEIDMKLLIHSDLEGSLGGIRSFDYTPLLDYFGIEERVYKSDDSDEPEDMPRLFSSFDLLLHATAGEGFGIPIIEAAACGVPSIVTDCSAMSNFGPYALKVKPSFKEYVGPKQTFYSWPLVSDVAETIAAYFKGEVEIDRGMTLEEAKKFDIEDIATGLWMPFLREVQDSLA